tara:strand:- start:344 stop:547 length:204 start_codon:yes stop_codon:yes gene_type:complete
MRELDVLLMRFLDEQYEVSSEQVQQRFVALLETEDTSLYAWLTGQQQHDDADTQTLINQIISGQNYS